ncbi:hypothetical protein GE21DRAFT_6172 [Neurospora crassa]|uniref:Myb-like domain-containing protein n=1 Tax=Neurospora crassa (strain ATCC 24698 / 74-OR23-1A / CBS 708.71 / DSM 1257 / FGSC 987) TaxID=367110 RepID=Q7RW67_NEUCR|nr:hypothetical protein NCU04353 [Neurospora crassa OR74A]EAA26589.2 hypothetical protein NCU04353 [Neurospora crassa OR74A]KHE82312.1 hypothetical protein GE21DRAFT_6172 [Neurospora crassa]|eukprot:XP_955825.2 hypothetical protein NCU04353 [Neurospora crassa OR74A]
MPPAMALPTINDHDAQSEAKVEVYSQSLTQIITVNDAESHYGSAIDDAEFDYAQLDGIPRRRHQVESAGSEYEPPSDEDVDLEKTKRGRSRSRSKSVLTPRPPKRSSDGLALHAERPPKRHKTPFNHSYLALLNADITDAASRFVPSGDETTQQLASSQIGLTVWTPAEKELFFSAVSRLGPDSASAIALRIRTKSELEVAEYLEVFRQTIKTRQDPKLATLAQLLQPLTPAEVPAAVELSQQCCNALEEAADAVASRQESWEEVEEMRKWGENRWLIRKDNVKGLEMEAREETEKKTERKQREEKGKGKDANQDGDYEALVKTEEDVDEFGRRKLPALDLFRVRKMLDLSENVFMNSTVDDYNWSSMSDEPPAIRATALEDLHSLVVSLTRRLVAAVIYISESRIKAKRAVHPSTRNHVWVQDVEAAVLSLGLKKDSHQFWAKAARRLRLDVYGDEDHDYKEELARKEEEGIDVDVDMIRDEPEPMSYPEVEEALGLEPDTNRPESDDADEFDEDERSDVESLASLSSTPSLDELDNLEQNIEEPTQTEPHPIAPSSPAPSEHHQLDPVEDEAIKSEAKELLRYSALPMAITSRARQILYARIRTQRAQEAYADALDMRASYKEEKRMWQLLGREPPEDLVLVKGEIPQEPVATGRHTGVDELLGTRGVEVGAWREKVEEGFRGAEWEVEWQTHLEDPKERGR